MAISMIACMATCGPPLYTTTAGLSRTEGECGASLTTNESFPRLKSSSSKQFASRLGCLKNGVGLSYVRPSSSRFGCQLFPVSWGRPGAKEYSPFRHKSNCLRSSSNARPIPRLKHGSVASSAAAASTSCDPDDEAQQSGSGHLVNFLRRIETLRVLPVLVLGLGAVLTFRPGHAWAAVANEALSPQSKGLLASAWAGLVAGCLHTLTGPDHLAALAPLCIGRSRLQSAAVGALWGFGHDTGQILFGLVFLVLKDKLHIELIRIWASRVVGLTLMTIGGVGIYESQVPVEVLAQEAGMQDGGGKQEARIKNDSKNATTFATGVVYGLQPDALLMVLPALALPSRITGAAFLAMFLLGTVLAMGSYTLFLSSCSHALQKRIPGITKNLTLGSSLIAIALGLGLVASELFGLSFF